MLVLQCQVTSPAKLATTELACQPFIEEQSSGFDSSNLCTEAGQQCLGTFQPSRCRLPALVQDASKALVPEQCPAYQNAQDLTCDEVQAAVDDAEAEDYRKCNMIVLVAHEANIRDLIHGDLLSAEALLIKLLASLHGGQGPPPPASPVVSSPPPPPPTPSPPPASNTVSSPPPPPRDDGGDDSSDDGGNDAAAGIVIVCILLAVAAVGVGGYCFMKRRKQSKTYRNALDLIGDEVQVQNVLGAVRLVIADKLPSLPLSADGARRNGPDTGGTEGAH
eukprot:scaffold628_cov401-Prasinococcus_capsulatus_cf.AAC.15